MYLGVQRVVVTGGVLTVSEITVPPRATGCEIVCDTGDVRYTMDDDTNPNTEVGSLFKAADPPKEFLIEDINRIRFTLAGGPGSPANLNFHFFGGRDV